jgi:ABC-type multidrug transport system ATPase subunit
VLSIRNLSKTYAKGVRALDDVSLDTPKGMFGLLGPNGAGKSTLMRTIATLQEADSGSIAFGDIDVLKSPQALRRQLGYLPQDFGVYPRASARDMLDHLAQLKGLTNGRFRKRVVEELLRQTNLAHVARKALGGFSGGMRQRFGIAQALLGDPQLVIVDEPTAGLDPEERNRFHNLLAEIGENVIVILSTHIVDDVSDLCSQMAIMDGGRIVAQGAPADLVKSVQGKIWRKVIEKSELEAARARQQIISTQLAGGKRIVHALSDADPGDGFAPAEPELEHVYFATLARRRAQGEAVQAAAAA